jgi:hypothetical protein
MRRHHQQTHQLERVNVTCVAIRDSETDAVVGMANIKESPQSSQGPRA